jgi:hypothetical protein
MKKQQRYVGNDGVVSIDMGMEPMRAVIDRHAAVLRLPEAPTAERQEKTPCTCAWCVRERGKNV